MGLEVEWAEPAGLRMRMRPSVHLDGCVTWRDCDMASPASVSLPAREYKQIASCENPTDSHMNGKLYIWIDATGPNLTWPSPVFITLPDI